MSLFLPDPKTLYTAMLERDPAYDGHAFVAVTTTGIFCRLSCPARKPNFENSQFFDSAAGCLKAGFRPCLRCRPLEQIGAREPLLTDLMTRLEQEPDRVWSEADLVALSLDPSTVRRAFRRHLGISFLELAGCVAQDAAWLISPPAAPSSQPSWKPGMSPPPAFAKPSADCSRTLRST